MGKTVFRQLCIASFSLVLVTGCFDNGSRGGRRQNSTTRTTTTTRPSATTSTTRPASGTTTTTTGSPATTTTSTTSTTSTSSTTTSTTQPTEALGYNYPLPNHKMNIGYFFADGRYGDYQEAVAGFTNVYIALPGGYDSALNVDEKWVPYFEASLQKAYAANKDIFFAFDESKLDRSLDVAKPYWSKVKWIASAHEEKLTIPQTEARNSLIKSKLAERGMAEKPFGPMQTACESIDGPNCDGSARSAPSTSFVAIEAYLDYIPDETVDQMSVRLSNWFSQARTKVPADKQIFVIGQSYDRNAATNPAAGWHNIETLRHLQAKTYMNVYRDTRVLGILWFAYGRNGGAKDHPQLRREHEEQWLRIKQVQ